MTGPAAHEARRERSYAERSLLWTHGQKTEDELLQRIWNLANDVKTLDTDLAASRAQLEQIREAAQAVVTAHVRYFDYNTYQRQGTLDAAVRTLAALAAVPDPEEPETCPECGRNLHGYVGPRCRYCDGTAE